MGLVPREAGSDMTSTFSASLLVFRDPLPKGLSAKSFVSIPFRFLLLLRSRKGFIRAWNGFFDGDGDRLVGGYRLMAMLGNQTAVGELGAVESYSADVRTGVSSKLDRGLRLCSKLCRIESERRSESCFPELVLLINLDSRDPSTIEGRLECVP